MKVIDKLGEGSYGLRILVRHLDGKILFDCHDDFLRVQAIHADIPDELGLRPKSIDRPQPSQQRCLLAHPIDLRCVSSASHTLTRVITAIPIRYHAIGEGSPPLCVNNAVAMSGARPPARGEAN